MRFALSQSNRLSFTDCRACEGSERRRAVRFPPCKPTNLAHQTSPTKISFHTIQSQGLTANLLQLGRRQTPAAFSFFGRVGPAAGRPYAGTRNDVKPTPRAGKARPEGVPDIRPAAPATAGVTLRPPQPAEGSGRSGGARPPTYLLCRNCFRNSAARLSSSFDREARSLYPSKASVASANSSPPYTTISIARSRS